ncbi:Cellulose synthase (UDP-forming) [Bertholletia excelsa]
MGRDGYLPLFETKTSKGRTAHKVYAVSILMGICFIWFYRVTQVPARGEDGSWVWIGLFIAELWFSFYWFITQFSRWNPIHRRTFKDRLSQRYEEALPRVDVFVCTADPQIEPPIMVANTVLSVMAYDYPPEKLAVYLSDDGGSELTFFAILEASGFAKHWLLFCNKFKVEPRSPDAYFSTVDLNQKIMSGGDPLLVNDWSFVKTLYDDMTNRVRAVTRLGRIPEDIRKQHTGFRQWDFVSSHDGHAAILQILIDGREPNNTVDKENHLPTLVYLSREKRPQYHHNFKAGAMNALIRVSSKISNAPIIVNVDCDVYSNNSESVRDALCFFMDEEQSHQIAFVQYPQSYNNLTRNDLYGNQFRVPFELELEAMDFFGGPCYAGTGCFHRRDVLCGMKYGQDCAGVWKKENDQEKENANVLEEICKIYASCTYEENTQWGKEIGLKYGFTAEDIATGLSIQSKGWKSVYFNPERKSFTGVAPTTLLQSLVQMKRWSEGQFHVFLSKYGPLFNRRMPLKHLMSYAPYMLFAPNCLPTLYYVVVPSYFLLKEISLFPKITSLWAIPFTYVIVAKYAFSLGEFLCCGGTLKGWWNDERMWIYRRTTSFLFGFLEIILSKLGFSNLEFVVTSKVADEEVYQRYGKEIMEFGAPSLMFTILAALAMLNLFSFGWVMKKIIVDSVQIKLLEPLALQIILCGFLVLINLPIYQGIFFRMDKGRMPVSVTVKSTLLVILACSVALY